MATPKAQTLQQRFGFADSQLATPAHDQLMCELDSRVSALCQGRFGGIERVKAQIKKEQEWCSTNEGIKAGYEWPTIEEVMGVTPTVSSKCWESPVMNEKYMVGFVDMRVFVQTPNVRSRSRSGDLGWTPVLVMETNCVSIEVKPVIPSVGELIRQLRMYQQYGERGEIFAVASPDTQWISVLLDQGIEFIDTNTWEWHHR